MKLTILGSGTFFVNKDLSASSFLLDTGKKKILIDCGPGTLTKLSKAGFDIKDIDYVFITHFHPDHTSDLFPLFMNFRLSDIFTPGELLEYPVIYGPEGIYNFIVKYSNLTQLPAVEGYDRIKFVEYEPEIRFDEFNLKTYKVLHKAFGVPVNAYSLRFEIGNKVISFSGDSSDCEGVREVCRDSDLFICDASYPANQDINEIHMNTTEIAKISKENNVNKILLTHFYPCFENFDFVKEVKDGFDGEVIKATDLSTIEVF